jgi:hypothetical protein
VKIKVFAVVMAVMALVSCMCMPALAATNIPVQNGVSFSASHWSDDDHVLNFLEIEHGVTYTITTDPSITKLDLWIYETGARANGNIRFVDGVAEYTCTDTNVNGIVILCGDAENRPTVTVSWPIDLLDKVGPVSGALWSAAKDAVAFVMKTPLAQIVVVLGIVGIGCLLVKRFAFAQ